jgi:hypothetical protein
MAPASCSAPRASAALLHVTCSAVSGPGSRRPRQSGAAELQQQGHRSAGLAPAPEALDRDERRGAGACEAASGLASFSAPEAVLDRDEYRRGVGICLVNREGLVFTAK